MFNNLIESSSHFREYKRRGSFLLFTTLIYAVLLLVSGVVAIYAYDARLEKQNLEWLRWFHHRNSFRNNRRPRWSNRLIDPKLQLKKT